LKNKKIGVFSGTFDPVHNGHIESCLVAKEACELDKIYVFIENKPYRKTSVTSLKHRHEILGLALADYPSLSLTSLEVDNLDSENVKDSLSQQYKQLEEIWYIIGSDIFLTMRQWKDFRNIARSFSLCVILRSNDKRSLVEEEAKKIIQDFSNLGIKILPAVWSGVSSSTVKDDLKNKGSSQQTPKKVIDYIRENNLY